MAESQPQNKNTIITDPHVMTYLGKKSIDAASLPWHMSTSRQPELFGPAVAQMRHETDGSHATIFTLARMATEGSIEFQEYPPSLLFFNEDEWDAFLGGAKDGEFDI